MSRIAIRAALVFLYMAYFISCSNMIEWVEFHHNADIKNVESSAGRVRVRSGGDSPYSLALLPTDTGARLRVTPENPDATMAIRVDGGEFIDLPTGTYSGNVAPTVSNHVVDIRVTSPSGKTVKTYPVRVVQGETVRANRFAVWARKSVESIGGTVQLRITSEDGSVSFVTTTMAANDFPYANYQWVYFSLPPTDFYRGMRYGFALNHDQGLVNNGDPCVLVWDIMGSTFHSLLRDDVSITSNFANSGVVLALRRNEWLDSSFVVPW